MLQVALLLVAVLIAGCADDGRIEIRIDDSAKLALSSLPGRIGIVLHSEHPMVQGVLVRGSVEQSPERIEGPAFDFDGARANLPTHPAGYFERPYSVSPDGRFIAIGLQARKPKTAIPQAFVIIERELNRDRALSRFEDLEMLDDLAWSPDSKFIAALSFTERGRFSVMNTLSAISGHPVRYNTYYLTVFDINGKVMVRTKLAEGVPPSLTHLLWK